MVLNFYKYPFQYGFTTSYVLKLLEISVNRFPVVSDQESVKYIPDYTDKIVGESRDPNKANRTKVRQIAKFGMIVYYKIVINNLI